MWIAIFVGSLVLLWGIAYVLLLADEGYLIPVAYVLLAAFTSYWFWWLIEKEDLRAQATGQYGLYLGIVEELGMLALAGALCLGMGLLADHFNRKMEGTG